mmetsp:Transcript_17494/g.18932  ORF Transcript_17494/g.18932 Transcript_17494/m.18932 type:complete len:821 (+) Transcript_17494:145-2607(+)
MSNTSQKQVLITTIVSLTVVTVGAVWYWRQEAATDPVGANQDERHKQEQRQQEQQQQQPKHQQLQQETYFSNQEEEKKEEYKEYYDDLKTTYVAPILEIQSRSLISIQEDEEKEDDQKYARILSSNTITIAHGSVTGTCSKLAQDLLKCLQEKNLDHNRTIQMGSLEEWDWWDELLNYEEEENERDGKITTGEKSNPPVLLLLLPTHHGGSWPPTATCLQSGLQDLQNDWRVEKRPLKNKIQVAVMGMGCSDYGDDSMGKPAKEAFITFRKLGAKVFGKQVRVGDDSTGNQDRVLQAWIYHDILPKLIEYGDDDDEPEDDNNDAGEPEVTDMEDLGVSMESAEKENEVGVKSKTKSSEPKEMVTTTQAKALKKEGYKLIGTHSAVKLCRWTKHQLRGRGGCYKHTFYGINSYQCMEATPSLACANKCVFCWRHHKNPVGKTWRWKTDDPYFIVDEAVKAHIKLIKETRGIPGVNIERWQEAHTVRHCALSLVGEPIMYPRINEFLGDLHTRDISTFLVTNGQHPKEIESLIPITQLYVSVDAPTPESLIAIDRPLFSDAWERLKDSLTFLKDKGQRTVARLTVVKGWNSDEIEGYAKLIALGKVSLIEIKGVTFCGKSDASNLNMSNSPWHHEVVDLCRTLKKELDRLRKEGGPDAPPEYDLACEHKHSVSVLLARVDQFSVEGQGGTRVWKTWINYPKFQELSARHAVDPSATFLVEDYTAETPAWALFGSEEEGFDPIEVRHRRKKKYPKYSQFDLKGVPTHDDNNEKLSSGEYSRLNTMMDDKIKRVGCGSTVTALKGGERVIEDASLMFRGQVVIK